MFPLSSLPAVVASRCRRFPLSSLPAVVASRSLMRKAILLLPASLLCLLLAAPPSHAQMPPPMQTAGGKWVVTDSNGNVITPNPNDGSYPLSGSVTQTASEKYPGVLAAAGTNPTNVNAYLPNELNPKPNPLYNGGSTAFSGGLSLFAIASNAAEYNGSNVPYLGSPTSPVFFNGTVGMNGSGTLTQTWTWVPAPSPYGTPAPPLNLLVSAPVSADIAPNYSSPSVTSGLTGTASASNGLGDTASVTEGSSYIVQNLPGRHLQQFTGGTATVTISGQASISLTNSVLYGTFVLKPGVPPWGPFYQFTPTNGNACSMGGAGVSANAQQDYRALRLSRDGAHNETVDANGTVHGDTTYSYVTGNTAINNAQSFHPNFSGTWSPNPSYISNGTGPLFNISWQWNPSSQAPAPVDTWTSHGLNVDTGTLRGAGPNATGNMQWTGKPDALEHVGISYTATDLRDKATATASYDLRVHDQYDNWRRVDGTGNPISGSAAGDPGSLDQLGQTTTPLPATPVLTITDAGTDWNAVGIQGGGVLSAGSIALLGLPDPPTWPIIILGLAGLATTTVSSLPPPAPHSVSPPGSDHFDAAALSTAYQNYIFNLTVHPPQVITTNSTVDANFYSQLQLTPNPNFSAYVSGNYGKVSVTATVYQQMLNYYFYANQYDSGGLVTTTAPSTVHTAGGYVWKYLWSYAGNTPPPLNPPAGQ